MNILGYLDAIIRFPRVPSFDSFFAFKLVLCVIAKTIAYSMGFIDVQRWTLTFLTALCLNVWLLPVMYALIVPYGDSSPFRKDKDIVLALFDLIIDQNQRTEALRSLASVLSFSKPPKARSALIGSKDMTWI